MVHMEGFKFLQIHVSAVTITGTSGANPDGCCRVIPVLAVVDCAVTEFLCDYFAEQNYLVLLGSEGGS